jgi:DNA helicase-2/ATP-dependent DNA helicase PcrA
MELSSSQLGDAAAGILAPLTAPQREAASHIDGPLLILAGAGSGKTRVVTHRIAYLIAQGVPARQIVALTFTNKAAEEMKLRLDRLAPEQPVWLGTFHRFCSRLLRIHAAQVGLTENFSIYDTEDSRKLLTVTLRESGTTTSHVTPDQIAREISAAKNSLMTAEKYEPRPGNPLGAIVAEIYPLYQQRLITANAVDFDDLLLHVATMLHDNPALRRELDQRYRYICVDEYQDTNFAQYAIVRALSQDFNNLAATGDPDQSIYGWRGANLDNILDFEKDFPKVRVVRLEQNYRSTKSILRVADRLISHNVRRKQKALFTDNPEGDRVRLVVYPSCRDEAEQIAATISAEVNAGRRRLQDFAIFYRVNALSRVLENALRNAGLPYQIVRGLEFYQRREIKDVVAYLHLINNPRNDVALLRIINVPSRRIGKATINHLVAHAQRYKLPLLDAAREAGLIESIGKRAATNIAAFVAMYDGLSLHAASPLQEIVGRLIKETGYQTWLESSDQEEDAERLANVHELLNDAREFDIRHPEDAPLETFLEDVALSSDIDEWESDTDRVSLMTMHAAKGLEFPAVFIVAAEQHFMPHNRSQEDPEMLEEERRLLFVGITRAEENLQLSMACYRFLQGSRRMMVPSSFMLELPRDEMDVRQPPGMRSIDRSEGASEIDDFDDAADFTWDQSVEADMIDEASSEVEPPDPSSPTVVTAAEMLGEPTTVAPPDPESFERGMVIQHPEFGLGKIVALSGTGVKRMATVQFFTQPGERRFVLIHSPLQPVQSKTR